MGERAVVYSINNYMNNQYRLYLRLGAHLKTQYFHYIDEKNISNDSYCIVFDTEEDREQWKNLYSTQALRNLLYLMTDSPYKLKYKRLQYFKPGTTLEDVKQHFHLTDEEIKTLEDYH